MILCHRCLAARCKVHRFVELLHDRGLAPPRRLRAFNARYDHLVVINLQLTQVRLEHRRTHSVDDSVVHVTLMLLGLLAPRHIDCPRIISVDARVAPIVSAAQAVIPSLQRDVTSTLIQGKLQRLPLDLPFIVCVAHSDNATSLCLKLRLAILIRPAAHHCL